MSDRTILGFYMLAGIFAITLGLGYGLGAWAGWLFFGSMMLLVVYAHREKGRKGND